MNCRQARALFSPRIDNEVRTPEAAELERHLRICGDCAARWASFETTVRMVRALPAEAPDPSFVGQVLDRVRAFEDGERFGSLTPALARSAGVRAGGLADRFFRFGRGFSLLPWERMLQPAQWAGALAVGVIVGFVLSWTGLMPGASRFSGGGGTLAAHSGTQPSAVTASPASQSRFGDLARLLERRAARPDTSGHSLSPDRDRMPSGFGIVEPWNGTSQQVRLSGSASRPRITF